MSYYAHIGWVDEFASRIRPYVFVRETDHLLIKIPNEAYKLNEQGFRILSHVFGGQSIYTLIDRYLEQETAARDVHYFFTDLNLLLKGCYHERGAYRGIERIPFEIGFNRWPVLSEIALTYRCNLACRFCYAGCGCRKSDSAGEMDTEQAKTVLGIIRNEAQIPSVSFTGGEPMLRQDLPELIRHAKSLSMWTNLITNGTLIPASAAVSLREAGLDSAQISLEAGNAGLHDRIVQHSGAFERTINGLRQLMEAGIRVHTNTTISAMNRTHLKEILDLVQDLGLKKLSMNLLMPAGASLENLDDLLVSYTEIGPIVLDLKERAGALDIEFMWYSPTPVCIFNPIVHGLGNKGCSACDGLLSVAPNGDVLPCSSYPEPVGNLLNKNGSFGDLWESSGVRFFRDKQFVHEKCRDCEDLAVCNGGCPLYWRHVGYQELVEDKNVMVSGS
ncbi:radical SAM protein [bacterium]|nr:radical SAM protein [bacterium]